MSNLSSQVDVKNYLSFKRLNKRLSYLTEPSPRINNTHWNASHILNIILITLFPLTFLLFLLLILAPYPRDFVGPFSMLALGLALVMIMITYLVNRLGFYIWAVFMIFGLSFPLITINAMLADKPHLEILFLMLLPLTAISVLKWRQTVLITVITCLTFLGFISVYAQDFPTEIRDDLTLLFILESILILFVAYWNHIAEQQRLKLLIEHEKAMVMKDLLSNISHDLKTPLSVIASNLYLLKNMTEDERALSYVDRAERQVWRLEKSILDVMVISRLDTINNLANHSMDLEKMVNDCLASLSSKIEQHHLHVELNLANNLPRIQGSEPDMMRAIENLLENAINYTADEGRIAIKLSADQHHLTMAVRDSGIGIAPENTERIFERFYRADRARSISTGGTGLGLSIVKKIIEMHGGTITVESQLNQGTTFTVRLPHLVTTNQHLHR